MVPDEGLAGLPSALSKDREGKLIFITGGARSGKKPLCTGTGAAIKQ